MYSTKQEKKQLNNEKGTSDCKKYSKKWAKYLSRHLANKTHSEGK